MCRGSPANSEVVNRCERSNRPLELTLKERYRQCVISKKSRKKGTTKRDLQNAGVSRFRGCSAMDVLGVRRRTKRGRHGYLLR
jgi:hypothetical protein